MLAIVLAADTLVNLWLWRQVRRREHEWARETGAGG